MKFEKEAYHGNKIDLNKKKCTNGTFVGFLWTDFCLLSEIFLSVVNMQR